ncbi:Putative acyl-CoA synthetase YngI [Dietzia timorensis]|uniref:Putative acyl-CoA synthetase YngI n=2 Tax=Dietzia timorensis TaxID=499555 RepID=A0A173LL60_9ACTN|nr:Putative acyl-CoA synthetase YngI [Dietzia timorensis]
MAGRFGPDYGLGHNRNCAKWVAPVRGPDLLGEPMSALSLSHARGAAEPALLTTTIGENLARTTERFGERDALVDVHAGVRFTYAEFLGVVRQVATGLLDLGVTAGDRVGVWSPNRWEWTVVQYATAEIGAILVNINPAYRTSELSYVLGQSGISVVLAAEKYKDSDYAGMLEKVRPETPGVREIVLFESEHWQTILDTPADEQRLSDIAASLRAADPINIQYTSGTTGFPKGATLSHTNILNNGYMVGELVGYSEVDRVCIPVPFYHCFGMVMGNLACTSHGAAMVIPAPTFDPVASLTAVEKERCTSLYGVPTMFIAELALDNLADFDLGSLRTGIMAGSPCPENTMRRVMSEMGMEEVSICYGMTETSPVSTQTRVDDSVDRRVSTVGRVGPHLEVKIADPSTGETLPIGVPGELCTRGYSVMLGYWENPEKTSEALVDGWMRTGDIGVMDSDGYVQVTGRIKDMVIRGGENIYPREIEEFLYTHPDVVDAQVIGVPDAKYGEELMAWIRLSPGADELTAESLRAFADGKLARHKIPRYVHIVDEFPMTVTGKVRKVEMRAEAEKMLAGGDPS